MQSYGRRGVGRSVGSGGEFGGCAGGGGAWLLHEHGRRQSRAEGGERRRGVCGDHPWWRVPRSWLLLVGRLQRGCPDGRTGMPPMGGTEFRGRLRWAARVARPLGGAGTAGRGLLQAPVVAVGSSAARPRGNQAAGRGGIGVEVDPGCRAWQRAETDCLGPVLSIDTTRPSSRRAFGRPVWCPRPGEDSPHCRSIPGGASQTQA